MMKRRNLLAIFTAFCAVLGVVISQIGDLKAAPPVPASFVCLPTCSVVDGRMLVLAPAGTGLTNGTMEFAVHSAPSSPTLQVGIFDADARGASAFWDDGVGSNTSSILRYELVADPNNNGSGTTVVDGFVGAFPFLTDLGGSALPGSLTGDNAWYDFVVNNSGAALGTDGAYHYRLRITTTGFTTGNVAATGSNDFKVRTDGTMGLTPQPFSFIHSIHNANDILSVYPNSGGLVTGSQVGGNYDGTWEFSFYVPTGTVTSLAVWDGDMDFGAKACNGAQDTDDLDTNYTVTPNTLPFPAAGAQVEGVPTGVACTGGISGQRSTGNPADDVYTALDPAGSARDIAFMRNKQPTASFGLDLSGQPYPNVAYRLQDLQGNVFRNTNPSGQNEWEQFRLDTNTAVPADFHPTSINSGTWRVHLEGQDSGNLSNWYYNFNVLGVTGGGDPTPEAAFYTLKGVVFADTNSNSTRDIGESAFANAKLTVLDNLGNIIAVTQTDSVGNYDLRVAAGTYNVVVDNGNFVTLLTGLVPTTAGGNTSPNLTVGGATGSATHDFGYASNRPPVAVDDVETATCGAPITIYVLSNDSDPDGDAISVAAILTNPSNGSVVNNGNGTVTYTSVAPCPASVTFTYQITDGKGLTSQATVTVNMAQPPVAVNDAYSTYQDVALVVNAASGIVLTNDTDPNNGALLVSLITNGPSHGTAAVQPDGSFVYTPNTGFTGTDTFDYKVANPQGLESNVATVTITVNPKRTMTVTATGGTFPYDGNGHGGTCTFSDGLTGTFNYTDLGTSLPVHVNTYTLTCEFPGNDEFAANSATATIEITPLAATITAGGGTKVYGTGDPALSAIATVGFINGDEAGLDLTQARVSGEDVGSYPTSATLLGNTTNLENYAITYNEGTFTITPATPTATATGGTFPYDGNEHPGTCTISGGLVGVLTYSDLGTTAPTHVGTYTVFCDYEGDTNHNPAHDTATITITPLAATITAGGGTKVYGTGDPALGTTTSGFIGSDAAGLTLSTTRTTGEDVGSYPTTAAILSNTTNIENYAITYVGGNFTITPATPTATATGGTFPYDGASHEGTCTISDGLVGTLTYTPGGATAPTAIGTYTVNCDYDGDNNHNPAHATSTITITPKAATITAGGGTKVYGTLDPALSAMSNSGFSVADAAGITFAQSRATGENVGSYVVTPTATGGNVGNYTVTSNTGTFTITPAKPTATATGGVYVYDGTSRPGTCTISGGLTGSLTYAPGGTTAPKNVGTYTVLCTYAGDLNHDPASDTATITITPKAATVTAGGGTKVYGSADPALSATTSTGFLTADLVGLTLNSTRATGENVGSYVTTATATGGGAGNYSITYNTGTFTITPKAATVTAGSNTKVYGSADPALATTSTGISSADLVGATLTTTRAVGQNVGSYVTTATATGGGTANYTLTFNTGTFTITKAPLTVVANNKTKTQGAVNPTLDGTLTGVVNGDNITATYSTTAVTASPVGTYPITPALVDPTSKLGNYTVTITNGTLTVTSTGPVCTVQVTNDAYEGNKNQQISIVAKGILRNDVDPYGRGLQVATVNGAASKVGTTIATAHGTVKVMADGSFVYKPATNYVGTDTFTYTAKSTYNNQASANTATVTVTIKGHYDGDGCDHDRDRGNHRDGDRCDHDKANPRHYSGDGCDHDRRRNGHHSGDRCTHDNDSHRASSSRHYDGDSCDHDRNRNGHRDGDNCSHDAQTNHHNQGDNCDHDRGVNGHRDGDDCSHDREEHYHRDGDGCDHDRGANGHRDGDRCEHDNHHDDDNDGTTGCAVSGGSNGGHHHSDDESDDEHHSGDGCDHDRGRNGHSSNDNCDHNRRTKHYDGDRCDHDRNRSGHRSGDRCDHDRATRDRD